MPKSFKFRSLNLKPTQVGPRLGLQIAVGMLGLANLVMLFLYLAPPGGSRRQLTAEGANLRAQISGMRVQTKRLEHVSARVQLGSEQAGSFETRYILANRQAYGTVMGEIQRMAQTAALAPRESVLTEDPIEGTADLSVLNVRQNFEGSYSSLMRFLYEVDRSPMMLILESLQASPQKTGQITAAMRFQAVVRDEANAGAGAQQ